MLVRFNFDELYAFEPSEDYSSMKSGFVNRTGLLLFHKEPIYFK